MISTLILINVVLPVSSLYYKVESGNYTVKGTKRGNDTVSNFSCRPNHSCGRYSYSYSWCYTDPNSDSIWDYCCERPCRYYSDGELRCNSGTLDLLCGNPGSKTALLYNCDPDNLCGHHGYAYFWCYTDKFNYWDYCCHPNTTCITKPGYTYTVCNVGPYKDYFAYTAQCEVPAN